jgi:hypothetical protein
MPLKRCSKCDRPIAALDVYDPRPSGPVCSQCMLVAPACSGPAAAGPAQDRPRRPENPWASFLDILAG